MKKIVIWIIASLVICFCIVKLLPTTKIVSETVDVDCPIEALNRNISNPSYWTKWWPGKKLNNFKYSFLEKEILINKILLNGFEGQAQSRGKQIKINLQALTISSYTSQINLTTQYAFSSNVVTKLIQYVSLLKDKSDFTKFLQQIQVVFSSTEKTYGFNIERQRVPNSSYISVKQSFTHSPTTEEIYSMIQELEKYIASQNSNVANAPIVNIYTDNNKEYEVMVAIATDRDLPSNTKYSLKNMMLGNIMVAEVKGDRKKIDECIQAMKYYISDYKKSSPAIYFERLITNRLAEKDSTQWITTINYPIFN
jgi:predicted transcriptional regulator YdeE